MSNKPTDSTLYEKVKKEVYKDIPKHSAYRSGIVVQKYKKRFTEKYGKKKKPYTGKKTQKKGLKRWFAEDWRNQRGEVGYKYKNDIYRPKKRITEETPDTHDELTEKEIKKARRTKYKKGRVNRFKKGGNKTQKKKENVEFKPNLSPRDIFKLGSFGGTYWRPIYSSVTKQNYKNVHKKYPKSWWEGIPDEHLTKPFEEYDKSINKYGVKVGMTLEYWEEKDWINPLHPYGWIHWYCDYSMGKRSDDDERQISRWKGIAGKNGRFTRWLVTELLKKNAKWNDYNEGKKLRQILQHWGYKLTKSDYDNELKRRAIKKKGGSDGDTDDENNIDEEEFGNALDELDNRRSGLKQRRSEIRQVRNERSLTEDEERELKSIEDELDKIDRETEILHKCYDYDENS